MLCILLLAIYINKCLAVLDFCHGDPEIDFKLNKNCSFGHLISIPQVHGNPYHALHDTSWAVSHYLSQCIESKNSTHLWIKTDGVKNFLLCNDRIDEQKNILRPSWGACIIMGIALNNGIPLINLHFTKNEPAGCFHKTTVIPARFRPFKYCIRPVGQKWWRKRKKMRWLPIAKKRSALFGMVDGAFNTFKVKEYSKMSNLINVLVYDRKNVRRRRWNNVNETLEKLRHDTRLNITYMSALPDSFGGQIGVFRSSDLVITPHGAALANSIFMRSGSEIIEIHKCCRNEVRLSPRKLRAWTGWHAPLMSLGVHYVQCHPEDSYLSISDLNSIENKNAADRWCSLKHFKVHPDDVLSAVNQAVKKLKPGTHYNRKLSMFYSEIHLEVIGVSAVLFFILINYKRSKKTRTTITTTST